jgi:hypothetical protein
LKENSRAMIEKKHSREEAVKEKHDDEASALFI